MADVKVRCPRCRGTLKANWHQPGGKVVEVNCGLCRQQGTVDPATAARERPRGRGMR